MPTTAELLAALPADALPAEKNPASDIDRLRGSHDLRRIPTGAWQRIGTLGGLSAKLSMAYFAFWVRSWYKPNEASEKDLLETHLRSAIQTFETMAYLRGAVAKAGQLLTCFPDLVPEAFVDTLSELHFQAPPMHFALVREQLLNEIGDPEEVFKQFDETAIAAASIGQVHRAMLKCGEEVAVKVQYPGIARTIQADMKSLKTMLRPMAFNQDWRAIEACFDEIRSGFERETDYEIEAANLREIAKILDDDEEVVVPQPIASHSSQRVLTMDFIEGRTFNEFLQSNPSQTERDHFGRLITKAIYRVYTNRMLYTDAHPGNFIFMDDGRLGLIDCGNVRRFGAEEWQFHREVQQARYDGVEAIRAVCIKSLLMTEAEAQKHSRMVDLVVEGCQLLNEPILYEGAFDYGNPEYLRKLTDWFARTAKCNWMKQLPANLFAHRLNFQLPALLFQLKSRVNVPATMRDVP